MTKRAPFPNFRRRLFRMLAAALALALAVPGCVGTAEAQTNAVQFNTAAMTGQVINRALTITPTTNSIFNTNGVIYAGLPIVLHPTNGVAVTNLLAGAYDCVISGIDQVFTILVTNSATLQIAGAQIITPTNQVWPGSGYAFDGATSDGRYQSKGTNQATATAGQVYAWDPVAQAGYFTDQTGGTGGGISASTATNIAAFQAKIATNTLASNLLAGGVPVTALSVAGAANGNVPTFNGNAWTLATPSGSGGNTNGLAGTNVVVLNNNGSSTNQFLTSTPQSGGIITIRPPLEYFGTGTVTALPGSISWTISGGSHVFAPGEYVSINTNGATKQYMVSDYLDSTHFFTVEPAGENGSGNGYTNAPYKILPRSVVLPDENGNDGAVIANGSDYLVIGEGALHNHNTGRLGWLNGTNSWFATVANSVNRLDFFSQQNHGTPVVFYDIPDTSKYEALVVYSDGHVNARFGVGTGNGDTTPLSVYAPLSATKGGSFVGLTNTGRLTPGPDTPNGSLVMVGSDGHATNVTLSGASIAGTTLTISGGGGSAPTFGPQFGSANGLTNIPSGVSLTNVNSSGTIKLLAASAISGSGLLSGSVGSYMVTNSIAAFTNVYPGSAIYVSNVVYVVFFTNSATVLTLVDYVQVGWSNNATWTQSAPSDIAYNSASQPTQYRVVDGSWGNLNYGNGGARIIYGNTLYPSNSFYSGVYPAGNNLRFGFGTLSPNGQGIFNIDNHATYDALRILADNTISLPGGATNAFGNPLSLLSPVSAPAGGSFVGLTNTGHLTVGPDVPNTSLMMVGSDGHATNVTLGTGLSFSGTTLNDSGGGGSDPTKASTNAPTIWNPKIVGGLNITNPATLSWINSTNDSTVWSNGPAGQTVIITNGSVTANGNGFIGSGATLSNLNASQVIAGTLPAAQLGNVFNGTNDFYGTNNFHSVVDFTGAFVYFGANLNIGNGDNVWLTNGQYFAVGTGGFTAGASGQFTGNAAGLTNYAPDINSPQIARTLWRDGVVANSSTTETAISTNTLPANLLAVNGNAVDYWLHGTNNNTGIGRTLTWKVYYGATTLTIGSTATTTGIAWEFHISIVRISASVVDIYAWGQIAGVIQNVVRATDTGSTASTQPLSVTMTSTSQSGDMNARAGRAQFIP